MYTTEEAKCPYCNISLNSPPTRKAKCKSCSNHYYVRTRCLDRKKVIVTEQEIDAIEKEWTAYYLKSATSPSYLIPEDEFQEAKRMALAKGQELSKGLLNDIVWGLLNKKLMSEMKRGNWAAMGQIYYEMAQIMQKDGKEYFQLLLEAAKCKLKDYRKQGVEKVSITSAGKEDSCAVCYRQDGKVLSIEEALKTMPIPVKECSTEVFVEGKGFCRCDYSPHVL